MEDRKTIPVWGGNFSPLRLVALDGDDWTVSLDEINAMRYDSTKLFRSSMNIDVGIAPLSLIVLFDGTLVLPRCSDISKTRALTIFNRHLTDLLLGGIFVNEVSPDDVTPGSLNLWGYHRHHCPTGRYARLSQSLRTRRADPDDAILLLKPKILTKSDYLLHHATGRAISGELPEAFSAVLLPSCTAFCNEEWERALILGWTSMELILEKIWVQRVVDGTQVAGIKKQRRNPFLSDTRTWSSSTRIELLWQIGVLTDDIYAFVDKARAARNAFIHSAKACAPEDARSAIDSVLSLIEIIAASGGLLFKRSTLMHMLDESTEHFRSPIADEQGRLLIEPTLWRYPDPAPGFDDWGDRPFEKRPEIQLRPLQEDV
jgi:hypothetical protein